LGGGTIRTGAIKPSPGESYKTGVAFGPGKSRTGLKEAKDGCAGRNESLACLPPVWGMRVKGAETTIASVNRDFRSMIWIASHFQRLR
jgi:hypothetical protein